MAWQLVRTTPVVLASSAFASAGHWVGPMGNHLDLLVIIIGGPVLLALASVSGSPSPTSD
jgi:hypothetical protein